MIFSVYGSTEDDAGGDGGGAVDSVSDKLPAFFLIFGYNCYYFAHAAANVSEFVCHSMVFRCL